MIADNILWTTWICIIAALLFIVNFKKLDRWEWLILLIIVLNIAADFSANYMHAQGNKESGMIYNLLSPIQHSAVLLLYTANSNFKLEKKLNLLGICLVLTVSIISVLYYPNLNQFHRLPYIISGCVVAGFSYFHLKSMVLERAGTIPVIVAFCLANFVYLTLMVSSQSAVELAYDLDPAFGKNIYLGNDIGYALWSVILIIGILWKTKQKI